MGRGLVPNFHTRCLYQKSHSLAAFARLISDTLPTRAKIPYAPPVHEVISISVNIDTLFQLRTSIIFFQFEKCTCTLQVLLRQTVDKERNRIISKINPDQLCPNLLTEKRFLYSLSYYHQHCPNNYQSMGVCIKLFEFREKSEDSLSYRCRS